MNVREWPVVVLRGWARSLTFVALAGLAACGGGGDGGGAAAPSVTPAATATLAIAGFTPASGGVGSTVTIAGAGFSGLQDARLGSLSAAFTVASDTQLQFVVPAGARTGRIELAASGRTVVSATEFTVSNVPQVASLAPTSVLPGGRIMLTGSSLDRVAAIRVNSIEFPIASQTATSLAADVPANATSGTLTLIDSDGIARPQSQQLDVVAPMTVASFTPTSVITGQTLTVNGANLDRATAVMFAGGATGPVATRSGTTRITVTVPDAAATGAIEVQSNGTDRVVSASPLTVIPAIRVDSNAVYRVAAAGANVTVPGSGLTEVSALTVAGVAAPIVARTATQIVFTVPSGLACGALSLQSTRQPAVAGGTVVVGGGCAASLAGIEFAQVLAQSTAETRQRLVPGKETWVRAYVVSDQSGIGAPTVRLTGYRGPAILGTLPMNGPATLPNTRGAVTDALRYSETASFNAELPASWVAGGLSVRIEVDPEQRLGAATVQDATPNVGAPTRLDIVLVPIVSGTFVPTVPSAATVLDELTRRFPIPRDRITVSTRAAYTLTSVSNGLDTTTEWSDALNELRQLRNSENPNDAYRYYFGFVRRAGGGVAGIGYVPGRAALGWDSSTGWARTMSHELGHNLGRPHAPCGGVSGADASYPYAGGSLGPQPLVDSVPAALDIASPVNQSDIMGYCSGTWFSDYNYRLMQSHLESLPQADAAFAQSALSSDLLLVAGAVGPDGVRLRPVHALRGTPAYGVGDYTLRLVTRDGRTIDHPFDADLVDHAMPPERHFAVAVLDPGPLARIEVWRGGARVPVTGSMATAQGATASREPMAVDWTERGGRLHLRWNAAAAAHASVTHVHDTARTVLALQRQGGTLTVDTTDLPPGGTFEFSLSDGLNARLITVRR